MFCHQPSSGVAGGVVLLRFSAVGSLCVWRDLFESEVKLSLYFGSFVDQCLCSVLLCLLRKEKERRVRTNGQKAFGAEKNVVSLPFSSHLAVLHEFDIEY